MSRLKDSYAGCMECGGSMKMKSGGKWIQKAVSKNPGSFTKQAQSAGMSVAGFRNKVLANKSDYSSTTVKRANLAKTLSKMNKGMGGMSVPGVNGSIVGPSVPTPKTGQSFPRRNAGTSKLAKFKKK
jgi:hypothetical protein